MAFSFIASGSGGSGDARTATSGALNTTGADVIFIALSWYSGGGVFSLNPLTDIMSDSKGNTWDHKTRKLSGAATGIGVAIFYTTSAAPTVGSGHTFTMTFPSDVFPAIAVVAFSGAKTISPFDQESAGGSASASTTIQPGSLTPTGDDELLITGLTHLAATGVSGIDSSFTIPTSGSLAYQAGSYMGVGIAYRIQTSAVASNPTWTLNSNVEAAAVQLAWQPQTGAAAGGQPTMRRWGGVPHVGGRKGVGRSGGGGAWGRTRDGLWIPRKAA